MSKVDQSCLQRRTKGSNFLSGSHFMRDPSAADIFCSDSYFCTRALVSVGFSIL